MKKNFIYFILGVSLGVLIGLWIKYPYNPFLKNDDYNTLRKYIYTVKNNYIDEINLNFLIHNILSKITQELDPYSNVIYGEEFQSYKDGLNNFVFNFGFNTSKIGDTIIISKIINKELEDKYKLEVGDAILAINNIQITDSSEILQKIVNNKNIKKAKFKIKKCSSNQIVEVKLKKKNFKISNIFSYVINDTIGYLKIYSFHKNTYKDFKEQIENLEKKGIKNYIFDLRDNPGGYFSEVIQILDLFFGKDTLVITIIEKGGKKREYFSTEKQLIKNQKIIILVNTRTASAAELFAGVLQDYDKAIIIGMNTIGKGVGQADFKLSENSFLHITTSKFLLPSGRWIQRSYLETNDTTKYYTKNGRIVKSGLGITPDIFAFNEIFELSSFIYNYTTILFVKKNRAKICALKNKPDSLYSFIEQNMETYSADFSSNKILNKQILIWKVFDIYHFNFVDSLKLQKDLTIKFSVKYFTDTLYNKVLSNRNFGL